MIGRGLVYDVDLGVPVGHEPGFRRPALVISTGAINQGAGELVSVAPITSTGYGLRSHVEVQPDRAGLDHVSYVRCDQIRVISVERIQQVRGRLTVETMYAVDRALRFILDL